MANNTAISAKGDLHMVFNGQDRLLAYRVRMRDIMKENQNRRKKRKKNKAISLWEKLCKRNKPTLRGDTGG